jgi:hypothetical protein
VTETHLNICNNNRLKQTTLNLDIKISQSVDRQKVNGGSFEPTDGGVTLALISSTSASTFVALFKMVKCKVYFTYVGRYIHRFFFVKKCPFLVECFGCSTYLGRMEKNCSLESSLHHSCAECSTNSFSKKGCKKLGKAKRRNFLVSPNFLSISKNCFFLPRRWRVFS